jgi:hypothetical protein
MASLETSAFGSEFMAIQKASKYGRGLRYKLHMFVIPVNVHTFIFGDNQSMLCNTSMLESTLRKKTQSIAYHVVCEGCAADEWRTSYLHTSLNLIFDMTNPLSIVYRPAFVARFSCVFSIG